MAVKKSSPLMIPIILLLITTCVPVVGIKLRLITSPFLTVMKRLLN